MVDSTIIEIKDDLKFCEAMLQKVSRTFAINIGFLKGNIYKTILCGYLFCRIIDTIEDSKTLCPEKKIEALNLWQEFFPSGKNFDTQLDKFKNYLPKKPENYDELLVRYSHRVFDCFRKIDNNMIELVTKPVNTMAKGMAKFQEKLISSNRFYQLKNMDELEKYCYFVAGTVGEMLTALFIYDCKNISNKNIEVLEKNKISFGLGLQMTNIIKDFKEDLSRSWIYIPESLMSAQGLNVKTFLQEKNTEKAKFVVDKLIESATFHLDKAFEYCMALPRDYGVRMFHLLPLHFAIYTLAEAKQHLNELPKWHVKISRKTVTKLILKTKFSFFSNSIQKSIYQNARGNIL